MNATKSIQIVLTLDEDEARWLKQLVQNPITSGQGLADHEEPTSEYEMRVKLFRGLERSLTTRIITSDQDLLLLIPMIAIGCFCAGHMLGRRHELYWRIKWIELEHDTARALGREPRNIKEVEPK